MFTLMVLAFSLLYTARISTATVQTSRLQDAADAAALAGAQQIVSQMPGQIVSSIRTGDLLPGALGQPAASDFAMRNGANVVEYRYYPQADRVEVRVRSQEVLATGDHEYARATAQVGLHINKCVVSGPPTPTTPTVSTPSPGAPSPTSTPSAPTTYDSVAVCGELQVPVTMPITTTGSPVLQISAAALKSRFTSALVA